MLFRQALINYANKKGVTKAAIRYKTNRQNVYRWLKRYDGTIESLADRSHRPHSHPNQHTPEEPFAPDFQPKTRIRKYPPCPVSGKSSFLHHDYRDYWFFFVFCVKSKKWYKNKISVWVVRHFGGLPPIFA